MTKAHAEAVADLHQSGIATGFLSSLGRTFLRQLYRAIPTCPAGFGFVWVEADNVLGFIACAEDTGRLYKQALRRRGLWMAIPLIRFLCRPSVIRRMIQTLRYPSTCEADLPWAELLSIVVAERGRGRGIGRALVSAMGEECRGRGIARARVAVWTGNEPACRFYEQCGFVLAQTREHHGRPTNIYVIDC